MGEKRYGYSGSNACSEVKLPTLDEQIKALQGQIDALKARKRAEIRRERLKASGLKKLTADEKEALGL